MTENLKATILSNLWAEMGGKMVGFAGYNMPVQFKEGVVKEHLWTRENAGLFDVSHMGPCYIHLKDKGDLNPEESHIKIAKILEQVLPCDIQGLKIGQIRYTTLLNDDGGVIDDLMVARDARGSLYVVVNAGGKEEDFAIFEKVGAGELVVERLDMNGLIALQGPKAKEVIKSVAVEATNLNFMNFAHFKSEFGALIIARSGYTGEDGFEILVLADNGVKLCEFLLANDDVKPIGLGARDSLRLEAGLCLYGHDLDQTISPIEADLKWTIQKCRRERGDFNGSARILDELANKPKRLRVGIEFLDKAPAREGVEIHSKDGRKIGVITSGGFGPSVGTPIAMGYVETEFAAIGTEIDLIVRGTPRPAKIGALPYVPHNYYKPA
ncbi:glycine cleavage system aminomethyltransferase GcvT [Pseudaquidulcibacter saccharophilus]|uniref:glycine cleavage system aminomethyltransferase GcvT n=1 Tax=Pseudaquidulcibacter saccharophilus TaxID=2831900 RepID=UPI001EFF39E3|nr:glycine cleavage system aminomethyltransferase GcvT [Pseudaquidulcibacter saccharophilus]